MGYTYEIIQGSEGLPVKTIIHAVDSFQMHWHNEMEFLLVLEGSVSIRVGEEVYYLKENDIILVNSDELHSTRKTKDENVLLAVQINSNFYSSLSLILIKLDSIVNPLNTRKRNKKFLTLLDIILLRLYGN